MGSNENKVDNLKSELQVINELKEKHDQMLREVNIRPNPHFVMQVRRHYFEECTRLLIQIGLLTN